MQREWVLIDSFCRKRQTSSVKKKYTPECAFFNLRVLIGLFVSLGGVVLALFACGAFANVFAEAKVPAPGSTKARETSATVSYTSGRIPIQGEGPVHILAAARPVKITAL